MKLAEKYILAISSDVGVGGVGLSIMRYVFAKHDIAQICLPSVLFASRPDLGKPARNVISPEALGASLAALEADGWFEKIDGVITGYFADASQIDQVATAIARLRTKNAALLYVLDPVFGDIDSGLYVDVDVASAVGDQLMRLADVWASSL